MDLFDYKDEFGEQMESLGRNVKSTVKNSPKDLKNTAQSQLSPSGTNSNNYSKDDVNELNKQMYGIKGNQSNVSTQQNNTGLLSMIVNNGKNEKSPQELEKMKELRNKLHYEVYYKQFEENSKASAQEKQKELVKQQQEEQSKKMQELTKDEKKKEAINAVSNLRKGTGEARGGVGG